MKKLLVIVFAVFFANAALAADSRSSKASASSNASSNSSYSNASSTPDDSSGWQANAKIHMSSFKAGGASKSNTPFSIGIGKGIMKNNTGNVLLEASLMTGEKYDYDFGWGLNWKFQAEMKMAAFASLYYQLNVASIAALKPYVGAGLGLAQLKYTSSGWYYGDSSTSGIGFAWQFALGADYFFNKNIAAGLGYAIRDYGSLEGLKMQSSGLFLGATYKF